MSQQPKVKKIGTKEEVFNGLALQTSGGLLKADLVQNSKGKIISKAKQAQGQKAYENLKSARQHKQKAKEEEKKAEDKINISSEEEVEIPKPSDIKPHVDENKEEIQAILPKPPSPPAIIPNTTPSNQGNLAHIVPVAKPKSKKSSIIN